MSRYIDADKLKTHAIHYVRTPPHFHYGDWDNMCISGKEIDKIIDTCPTADVVEVRRGEWLERSYGELQCSACGIVQENEPHRYNYCPCCGAKMDGESK